MMICGHKLLVTLASIAEHRRRSCDLTLAAPGATPATVTRTVIGPFASADQAILNNRQVDGPICGPLDLRCIPRMPARGRIHDL